ncbi:fatty acyl-AMP ligase [Streptomyces hundungensis]|uniref:fatty acyl-AMP ligase n=1 Tax=Streptomyces hundungensis TaxID=1077946 RepID=UPI0033CC75D7
MPDHSLLGPAVLPRTRDGAADPLPSAPSPWQSLPAVLDTHATARPEHPALSFVDYARQPAGVWQTLTFAETRTRARALAAALEDRFAPGSRVAVMCPQGWEYGVAVLACLYAGMTAVPLFPPHDPRRTDRLAAILADADPVCLLSTRVEIKACEDLANGLVPVWAVEESDPLASSGWSAPEPVPAQPAYLQYTSGSTGHPNAVVITHGNLVASTQQVADGCALNNGTPVASWLPLYHDMGLSIGLFAPVLVGAHLALMSPLAFIQRPVRWLRLLGEHRAHFSGGPNFAYDLCVRKIPDPSGLDLSTVRVLTNGAEPVRVETLRRFTRAFAPAGLAPDTLKPSYGLAEATVLVACNRVGQRWTELDLDSRELTADRIRILHPEDPEIPNPAHVTTVAGCGRPVGQDVRVADPGTGVEQPPGCLGELWLKGPNVAAGYFGHPEHSATVFGRTLTTPSGPTHPWTRTGDVGFVYDGEVFVMGRIKDVIIIHGANHTASDIEDTVGRAIPEAAPQGVAAFAVPGDGGDRLVVMVELTGGPQSAEAIALSRRVQQAVAERHSVRPHDVIAVRRGSLPRTTSGKLRRGDCRTHYLTTRQAAARHDPDGNSADATALTHSKEAQ